MTDRVISVLNAYREELDAKESKVMADMGRRWLKIEDGLQSDMRALSEEMARRQAAGETITQQLIWKNDQYERLERQMAEEIKKYNEFAADYIKSQQVDYANLGLSAAQDAIGASYYPNPYAFDKINMKAVESMIGFSGDGTPLSDLLKADYGEISKSITDALVNGVARGQNPAQTARDMNEAMGIGLDRSLLIARTETARAYRTSSTEQYRQSGVVNGFMRLVKKETACIACLFSDGQKFTNEEELDDHPNGKCSVVPMVEGVDPPQWDTGQMWFESLEPEEQKNILGESKYDMYKKGQVKLDDFVSTSHSPEWGDSPQETSISDLQSLYYSGETKGIPDVDFSEVGPLVKEAESVFEYSPTPEDLKVFKYYTGEGSRYINNTLRYDTPHTKQLENKLRETTRVLDEAIAKSTLKEDLTVYRGVNCPDLSKRFFNGDITIGDVISDKAFMSTTFETRVADNFSSSLRYVIDLPKGYHGLSVEGWSKYSEKEIILPRGAQFVVKEIMKPGEGAPGSQIVVHLIPVP